MDLLELTLPTAAENVALDEALLLAAESSEEGREVLRVWEPLQPLVVIGRASRAAEEAHLDRCRAEGVPVLRRASGGAAIVTGPGCLMYAVVLSCQRLPALRDIGFAHRCVLEKIAGALAPLSVQVSFRGTSDLAVGEMKVSGNSMRCRRDWLLYHGTLLYNFNLSLATRYLRTPPRQPNYRHGRDHQQFITNLSTNGKALRAALRTAFEPVQPIDAWPKSAVDQLTAEKYSQASWNLAR